MLKEIKILPNATDNCAESDDSFDDHAEFETMAMHVASTRQPSSPESDSSASLFPSYDTDSEMEEVFNAPTQDKSGEGIDDYMRD